MIVYSWEVVQKSINKIIGDFDSFSPELMVGIPRGGTIISTLISYSLLKSKGINVDTIIFPRYPLRYDKLNEPIIEEDISSIVKDKDVLVVDDGVFSGGTMLGVKKKMLESGVKQLRTASICYNENFALIKPDYCPLAVTDIVLFPWRQMFDLTPTLDRKVYDFRPKASDRKVVIEGQFDVTEIVPKLDGFLKCFMEKKNIEKLSDGFIFYDDNESIQFTFKDNYFQVELNYFRTLCYRGEFISQYSEALDGILKVLSNSGLICAILDSSLPFVAQTLREIMAACNVHFSVEKLKTSLGVPKAFSARIIELLNKEL